MLLQCLKKDAKDLAKICKIFYEPHMEQSTKVQFYKTSFPEYFNFDVKF